MTHWNHTDSFWNQPITQHIIIFITPSHLKRRNTNQGIQTAYFPHSFVSTSGTVPTVSHSTANSAEFAHLDKEPNSLLDYHLFFIIFYYWCLNSFIFQKLFLSNEQSEHWKGPLVALPNTCLMVIDLFYLFLKFPFLYFSFFLLFFPKCRHEK